MTTAPLSTDPANPTRLIMSGDWTLDNYVQLHRHGIVPESSVSVLDAQQLTSLDTAGAGLLVQLLGADQVKALVTDCDTLSASQRGLLLSVANHMQEASDKKVSTRSSPIDSIALLGEQVINTFRQIAQFFGFLGLTLTRLAATLPTPWRWRITALTVQMHQAGLNAVPIVALLNFLVGAVVAFLGATVLESFGATQYTVDLVAYAFMREMGVMLAAILLAGRTASAFTAQIGAMKVNEEVDALQVMGLNEIDMLVLPRFIALLIVMPLLAFLSIMSGLAGGAAVAILSLDISLARFLGILQEIPIRHMWLGLAKAPFFAAVVALIGCLEGFKVTGSARSVGERTTSAVVQCIFFVIVIDAIAALFYMEMGW